MMTTVPMSGADGTSSRGVGGGPRIVRVTPSESCCNAAWEAAYARFESPAEEVRKFTRRLLAMGAVQWDRNAEIVELFCGRGNGLRALRGLGFARLEGVDLSEALLARYEGDATLYVCDCRGLPFADASKDIVVVQGGLHHLAVLPDDLERTLSEVRRVLRDGGRIAIVEPWLTPFLAFVHRVCRIRLARQLWAKLDALAEMTEHERRTYEQWLGQSDAVLALLDRHFVAERRSIAWGKLAFVGCRR